MKGKEKQNNVYDCYQYNNTTSFPNLNKQFVTFYSNYVQSFLTKACFSSYNGQIIMWIYKRNFEKIREF